VEVFARSGCSTDITPIAFPRGPLAEWRNWFSRTGEVERELYTAAAFDPDIEGVDLCRRWAENGCACLRFSLVAQPARSLFGTRRSSVIVELIHIATLVHDTLWTKPSAAGDSRPERTLGNSPSAHWVIAFAHALNLSTNFKNAEISRAIARAAREICSGEMIQTQRRFDLKLQVEDYLRIVEKKTGSLFSAAAEQAALISEADSNVIKTFKNFGIQIGTAYQIYDDCLDLAGSETATGKTLGTDLRKGKFTLPVLIFLQSASDFAGTLLRLCRGN
jgi:octaprenyl-diphosphate synthase